MSYYKAFSVLIVLSAIAAYVNYRFLHLPSAIGIMVVSLIASFILVVFGHQLPGFTATVIRFMESVDFYSLLMGSMLGFMLFAGGIHTSLGDLGEHSLSIIVFSTISVLLSAFLVGAFFYYLLPIFSFSIPFLHCMLFGALISPTDPIAVLGILKKSNVPSTIEAKMVGESLFNDGVAVVMFMTLYRISIHSKVDLSPSGIAMLFAREAVGGALLGLALGYVGFWMIKSIDNHKVEIMLTLAMVTGGSLLANTWHVSGPLAMAVAGIVTGNLGRRYAMSPITRDYVDKFWELLDEVLNSVLFVMIGFELLVFKSISEYLLIGCAAILVVLFARLVSVGLPSLLLHFKERISHKAVFLLTWGGLRGGISVALALTLLPSMGRDLWVSITYMVVLFSIIVQGLSIEHIAARLFASKEV